jgi:hypothetical protein
MRSPRSSEKFRFVEQRRKVREDTQNDSHNRHGEALPIKQRPYWWSPYMLAEVNKEIDRMLENNVISPSDSPWSSPILLVKKSPVNTDFALTVAGSMP